MGVDGPTIFCLGVLEGPCILVFRCFTITLSVVIQLFKLPLGGVMMFEGTWLIQETRFRVDVFRLGLGSI